MKRLLFITSLLLTFFKVKAQQDSIPFLLPDYITETDTFHVSHWELYHRFDQHMDMAFAPFYISYKGGPFAVISMAICTMTHKPYFLMFIPLQHLPDNRIMLFFADAGGNVKGLFETGRKKDIEREPFSVCYSESIKRLIFKDHSVIFTFPIEENNMSLSVMKEHLCKPTIQFGLYMFKWDPTDDIDNISIVGNLYSKVTDVFCFGLKVYEDYIRLNNIDVDFAKK